MFMGSEYTVYTGTIVSFISITTFLPCLQKSYVEDRYKTPCILFLFIFEGGIPLVQKCVHSLDMIRVVERREQRTSLKVRVRSRVL